MKTYIQVLACLVILLQAPASVLSQDNAKRHISETNDNKIIAKVGPALRQHTSEPESHKLVTKIIGKVVEGEEVGLKVTLQQKSATIKTCSWTSPSGITYLVDKDSVTDADGEIFDDPNLLNLNSPNCVLVHNF